MQMLCNLEISITLTSFEVKEWFGLLVLLHKNKLVKVTGKLHKQKTKCSLSQMKYKLLELIINHCFLSLRKTQQWKLVLYFN